MPLAQRQDGTLEPDPARVVARLFLPGEELHQTRSRTAEIVDRVMRLPEGQVADLVEVLFVDYAGRHVDYAGLLERHAAMVVSHVDPAAALTRERTLLLGACFTAEYATEGAALCNPSAVVHPDQTDLAAGQLRVAVSLRGIGEGHLSSIGFASAVIDAEHRWSFEPRRKPLSIGVTAPARWSAAQLHAVLADQRNIDEVATVVLNALPAQFSGTDLDTTLSELPHDLLARPGASTTVETIRRVVSSAYVVEHDCRSRLDQRVLLPTTADESNGMEDARFTRFTDDDGAVEYRATYTAYDGHRIAPRMLASPDLRSFRAYRLAGAAARNKGMALFPRRVDGRYLALCRSDGENTGLTTSADGLVWGAPTSLQGPAASWEVLQVGNCGPPLETEAGWLVLTHGVGPIRAYSIGAMLLDLDDPTRVLGRLARPLLEPGVDEREGYVPNVVYSCGGVVHERTLWLPYGVGDARVRVARADLDELLAALGQRASSRV